LATPKQRTSRAWNTIATNDRVGTAAASIIFGEPAAVIMAALIMVSTFGCNNGLILLGQGVL
jgi:APA family basic amino acid/polyamine antiporter